MRKVLPARVAQKLRGLEARRARRKAEKHAQKEIIASLDQPAIPTGECKICGGSGVPFALEPSELDSDDLSTDGSFDLRQGVR